MGVSWMTRWGRRGISRFKNDERVRMPYYHSACGSEVGDLRE